jgi:hypothetical protein
MIKEAFEGLERYCRKERYRGWDVFDGLNSRPFRASPFYRSETLRLAWIQFFKRSPINLRRAAFVPKGWNPKGLALFASGMIARGRIDEAKTLLDTLRTLTCEESTGMSWGYNFPWQARAFYVPAGTPNMVTTVFAANAFLDFYDASGDKEALGIARASCEFVLDKLTLFEDEKSLCFGYIPGEIARVHNANMLGASLLGRVHAHAGEEKYLEKSRKSMAYSVSALTNDYLWPYGELDHHQFVDNFHTGFNLVSLKSWMDCTGEKAWEEALKKAYHRFLNVFWLENGCPKYYHNALYPVDIHCSAQGVITCLKLAEYDERSAPMAGRIATWAVRNMQDDTGYFYCQKTRWFTNKIPYIRWSQAWMYYALSLYLSMPNISA